MQPNLKTLGIGSDLGKLARLTYFSQTLVEWDYSYVKCVLWLKIS